MEDMKTLEKILADALELSLNIPSPALSARLNGAATAAANKIADALSDVRFALDREEKTEKED